MWEYQMTELPKHNLRCIAYDRRGFGKSDKPWSGYDYDTLATDLNGLIEGLELRNVTLVGFSMGGGEVARYLSLFGSKRVSKAVFIGSVTPVLAQTDFNSEGVDKAVFDEIVLQLKRDRPSFLAEFNKQFYGQGVLSKAVSSQVLDWTAHAALQASPKATIDCVRSFSETDFRSDLLAINVPSLIIHGDKDQIVPFDSTSKIACKMIKDSKLTVFDGSPHGLFMTDKEKLNNELISFINEPK